MKYVYLLFFLCGVLSAQVQLGVDRFFQEEIHQIRGKRVGLITNQTGVSSSLQSTIDLLRASDKVKFVALFSPEHGIDGVAYAGRRCAQ